MRAAVVSESISSYGASELGRGNIEEGYMHIKSVLVHGLNRVVGR